MQQQNISSVKICKNRVERVSAKMATTIQDLTVSDLKDVLRWLSLPTSGNKAELIARIYENDPNDTWVKYLADRDAPNDPEEDL